MSPQDSAAIAQGIGQVTGAISTANINRKQRKWNEKMYAQQRADALADWNMQNEYNSPRAQMQRFQEAGLNPHLIYGQQNMSPSVRSTEVKSWQPNIPQFDAGSIFSQYFDTKQRSAQIDLLEKQATIAVQTAALQAAKTGETLARTAKSKFDLEMANTLKNTSLQTAEENLRKLQIGNQFQLDENERREALTAKSLKEAAERILTMRSQRETNDVQRQQIREAIRGMKMDQKLKQLDIDLKEKGIQPTDQLWQRVLGRVIEEYTTGEHKILTIPEYKEKSKTDKRYYQFKYDK